MIWHQNNDSSEKTIMWSEICKYISKGGRPFSDANYIFLYSLPSLSLTYSHSISLSSLNKEQMDRRRNRNLWCPVSEEVVVGEGAGLVSVSVSK